jgi:hypothetical protein
MRQFGLLIRTDGRSQPIATARVADEGADRSVLHTSPIYFVADVGGRAPNHEQTVFAAHLAAARSRNP